MIKSKTSQTVLMCMALFVGCGESMDRQDVFYVAVPENRIVFIQDRDGKTIGRVCFPVGQGTTISNCQKGVGSYYCAPHGWVAMDGEYQIQTSWGQHEIYPGEEIQNRIAPKD